jgi:polysaccharide biosynthesis protein PelG
MAGIGFELNKMIQADRLSTNLRGFLHAAVIAAGPWLLTCVALALMQSLVHDVVNPAAMLRFDSVAVLAFSISLVVAGPWVLVVSRCLADAVYGHDVRQVSSMLLAALARVFAWLAPIGLVVFGVVTQLPAVDRMLGFLLLMACGGVWVVAGMLSALRSHGTVTLAFAVGVAVALLVARATVGAWQEAGMLGGLLLGQTVIFFVLAARLLAEFPGVPPRSLRSLPPDGTASGFGRPGATDVPGRDDAPRAFDLGAQTQRFHHLAWAGVLYYAGLWIDKWLMWLAPGAERAGRGVWSHPTYEGAMFLAFLTIVPVLAIFLVDVETRFHRAYQRWFRSIDRRATLRGIRRNHGAILRITASSFKRLALVQATIALIAILASPAVVAWAGGSWEMASVFRFGVLGGAFHVLLVIAMAALAYFDQRRWLLTVAATFFGLNLVLTLVGITLGSAFHGWGYAMASLLSFALAYYAAARSIAKLPFMTFIGTNASVRERRPAPEEATPEPARRSASVLAGGAVNRPT